MKKKFLSFIVLSFLFFGPSCTAASKTEVKLKVVRVVNDQTTIIDFYNPFNRAKFLGGRVFVVVLSDQSSFITYIRDRYKEGDEIDPRKIPENLWVK